MKTRHAFTLLLLSTVLLTQTGQSVQLSSQSLLKATNSMHPSGLNAENTVTFTGSSTLNESIEVNWPAWNSYISNVPTPGAGCFEVTYPSTVWQASKCGTAASIPLRPLPTTGGEVNQVGDLSGDDVAYSSSNQIGSSFGSFQSVTGVTTEYDSVLGSTKTNEFSLQINSQTFAISSGTTYTNNQPLTCVSPTYVCGWEQFVFLNDPSGTYGTQIYIQYWLLNYYTQYGYCPSTGPPGGGFNGQPWYHNSNPSSPLFTDGSCVSNSANYPSLTSETAPNLGNLVLKGYANFGSGFASCATACDEIVICYSGASCYAVALTDQVVNLYKSWQYSEFNVFGIGGGSEADFEGTPSITVVNTLKDRSGNVITPSCQDASYTGETNDLYLVPNSCTPNSSSGQIFFTESYALQTLTTSISSGSGSVSPSCPSGCSEGAGSSISVAATHSTYWQFSSWTISGASCSGGSSSNPCQFTMPDNAVTLKATFTQISEMITITSSPSGSGFVSVDGSSITTPQSYTWYAGSTHTLTAMSPVSCGSGCQYAYLSWSDGGGQSHVITVPLSSATYTADFFTEYYLTMQANPSTGGSVSPSTGWYSAGNTIPISETTNNGWQFTGWTGTGSGSCSGSCPSGVTLNGPITETADFEQLVTITSTSTTTSITSTLTSSTSTQRTTTTTTTASTSTSTVGQLCYVTSTSSTTNVIIQVATSTTSTSSTKTTTTTTTSSFQTTTFQTSTSTSTSLTTTSVTVCTQTSTATTTFTGTSTFTRPSTTISLLLNPSSISHSSPVTLSGFIVQNPGAVQVTVSFSQDSGSTWTTLMLLMTDNSGSYSTSWIPPYPGNYLLKASWNGNSQLAGSTSSTASLTVAGTITPSPTLLLTAPSTASRGQVLSLSIIVFNPSSSGMKANVTIQITGPSNYLTFDVIQVNVAPSSQSTAYFDWTIPNSSGVYTVTVGLLPPKSAAFDAATIQVT